MFEKHIWFSAPTTALLAFQKNLLLHPDETIHAGGEQARPQAHTCMSQAVHTPIFFAETTRSLKRHSHGLVWDVSHASRDSCCPSTGTKCGTNRVSSTRLPLLLQWQGGGSWTHVAHRGNLPFLPPTGCRQHKTPG